MNKHIFISLLICLCVFTNAHAQSKLTILTDVWPPYINPETQELGTASRVIDILFDYDGIDSQWHYLPYELSYDQIKKQKALAGFPYFKTKKRMQEVIYSAPVFSVTSRVYYNRQFLNAHDAAQAYKNKNRVGKVVGYSYGESIDEAVLKAQAFSTEKQALTALFNNEIAVLPMTEGVMQHQLTELFPLRKQLIVAINEVKDISNLHVIAAKNKQGEAIVNKLNTTLQYLQDEGMTSLQLTSSAAPAPIDVAQLITAEGYPVIIGQSSTSGDSIDYYTLPQGSQVLILNWSEKIIQPSKTDRIYKNMMDLSKVVLLNGPHVGKELYIRNMHIKLL